MKNTKNNILLFIILFFIIFENFVYADEKENIYISMNNKENKDVVTYAQEVTSDMTNSTYWSDKIGKDSDKLMLNTNEITKINQEIIDESKTHVCDISKITEDKTQSERKALLASDIEDEFNYMVRNYPDKDRNLYVNGELIDNLPYIENLKNSVLTTGFENDEEKIQIYSVAVKRTEIKKFPTKSTWGYDEPDDPDDESCNSTLEVNEPFVIRAKCTIEENTFYWGLSNSYTGWVNGKDLALFDSKQNWLDSWKVGISGKDFLVVTQDSIKLDFSTPSPEKSEVELKLGTVLKLVPENEIPESVNERKTWNNYVVYLPTRNDEGKYVRSYALIAEHSKVNIGYLPLTQKNILDVAFSCLGNRYGWGGMLGSMDCSAYSKAIYKCFGLDLPRDADYQESVPNRVVNLSEMSDEEKESYIEKLPIGTVLFFPGHAMVYIGSENEKNYVISDTGSLSDSNGDLNVRSMYSVVINPLTTRRRNGNTWLKSLTGALIFGEIKSDEEKIITEEDIYVTSDTETTEGNIKYPPGISSDMSQPAYFKKLLTETNKQLLNAKEIDAFNKEINAENNNDLNSKSILIVAQDRIILEPSISQPEISKVELPLGTTLELVPKEKIPLNFAERGPWNNYVVYLHIEKSNGEIEKKYALIPEHYNVNIGYLNFTPENIIDVAYRCLGDSNELIDNATFINSVYQCFGLELNINEIFETNIKDRIKDVSNMTIDEKKQCFGSLPVGSILRIEDEFCIYLGAQNDNQFSILSKSGDVNSIILNKLDLNNLNCIIDFTQFQKKEEHGIDSEENSEKEKHEEIKDTKHQDIEAISKDHPSNVNQQKGIITKYSTNPKTGDDITMWIGIMFISVMGTIAILYCKKIIRD